MTAILPMYIHVSKMSSPYIEKLNVFIYNVKGHFSRYCGHLCILPFCVFSDQGCSKGVKDICCTLNTKLEKTLTDR